MQTISRLTTIVSTLKLSRATVVAQATPPAPSTKAPVKAGAGVSPNNGGGSTALTGGGDDLDHLEVERRTVQGVERPSAGKPLPKPSAGTDHGHGASTS